MTTKQAARRVDMEAQVTPLAAQRELTPDEAESLDAGKRRWLPRIFQSYGTPIPELMASPLKTGLIFGAPAALVGGGLGAALGGRNNSALGALIGALASGGVAGTVAGLNQQANNEGLEELMRRLPENAAKRDLLADPQYQKDFLNWDDAQIVAQARARYYRPAERFDARGLGANMARDMYNRRYKYSQDTNVLTGEVMPQKRAADDQTQTSNHTIVEGQSMSTQQQQQKQAVWGTPIFGGDNSAAQKRDDIFRQLGMALAANYLGGSTSLGAILGGAGGAIMSKNKLKGFGRGALMGAGTGLGVAAGLPAGAVAGGMGGHSLAGNAGGAYGGLLGAGGGATLGGVGGYAGGKALADALIGQDDDEENKKAAQMLLDNKDLSLAEKMAQYGAMLAVQEKQAEDPMEVLKHLVGYGDRRSTYWDAGANALDSAKKTYNRAGQALGEKVLYPAAKGIYDTASAAKKTYNRAGQAIEEKLRAAGNALGENAYRTVKGVTDAKNQFNQAVGRAATAANNSGAAEAARHFFGVGDRRSTYWDAGANALSTAGKMYNRAGNWLGEKVLYPAAVGVTNAKNKFDQAVGGAAMSLFKPKPEPTMSEKLSPYLPYLLGGGAALGLGGLGYAMTSNAKKKKKRQSDESGEYGRKAASHINWYALMNTPVKSAAGQSGKAQMAKTLAMILGGHGTALGGVLGLDALLKKPDPSLLQQIMNYKYTPHIAGAGLAAAGLGTGAYLGSLDDGAERDRRAKMGSARMSDLGMGAGAGAAAGGAAAGLYGALNPGHDFDDRGRKVRRSRLMSALRYALGGMAAGAPVGAGLTYLAGHYNPEGTSQAMNKLKLLLSGKKPYDLSKPFSSPTAAGELPMKATSTEQIASDVALGTRKSPAQAGGVTTNQSLPEDVRTDLANAQMPKSPTMERGLMLQNPLVDSGVDMAQNRAVSTPSAQQATMQPPAGFGL